MRIDQTSINTSRNLRALSFPPTPHGNHNTHDTTPASLITTQHELTSTTLLLQNTLPQEQKRKTSPSHGQNFWSRDQASHTGVTFDASSLRQTCKKCTSEQALLVTVFSLTRSPSKLTCISYSRQSLVTSFRHLIVGYAKKK
jgi:hypothetical protein